MKKLLLGLLLIPALSYAGGATTQFPVTANVIVSITSEAVQAGCNALQVGMTTEQAIDIIGQPSITNELDSIKTLVWVGDANNIVCIATFNDNLLSTSILKP